MKEQIKCEESSGNVFVDLDFENPEEVLAKSELVRQIAVAIKKKKYTQKQTAEILGIDQSTVSFLLRGRLKNFSLDYLASCLNLLNA